MLKSILEYTELIAKFDWNNAIEAAAKLCDYPDTAEEIRKLKK